MKTIITRTHLALVVLSLCSALFTSQAGACKPTQEWARLSVDQKAERLLERTAFVAHIRIVELTSNERRLTTTTGPEYGSSAAIEVIELFKGQHNGREIRSAAPCGVDFRKGQELIVFIREDGLVHLLSTFSDRDFATAVPALRRLRDSETRSAK
jgi:hypothetical protein